MECHPLAPETRLPTVDRKVGTQSDAFLTLTEVSAETSHLLSSSSQSQKVPRHLSCWIL